MEREGKRFHAVAETCEFRARGPRDNSAARGITPKARMFPPARALPPRPGAHPSSAGPRRRRGHGPGDSPTPALPRLTAAARGVAQPLGAAGVPAVGQDSGRGPSGKAGCVSMRHATPGRVA